MEVLQLIGLKLILWITFVILLTLNLWQKYEKRRILAKRIDLVPGPPPLPVVGNAMQIVASRSDVARKIAERFKTYGSIFRIWFGTRPMISISNAEQAEVILNSTKHLEKSILYAHLEPWLGEGLLLAKGLYFMGTRWHTHRKLLTPAFHFKILEGFQLIFNSKSKILVERLNKKCQSNENFDVYSFISQATLDIICETAMGINVNAQNDTQSEYVKSIYDITWVTAYRIRRLWLHPDFLFRLTNYSKIFTKCLNILQDFTSNIINERRKYKRTIKDMEKIQLGSDENTEIYYKKRFALLDLLLEASYNGVQITEKAIKEEVDTFTFEGHDTTATGISWCLFLLGCYPEHQELVYQELMGIFGDHEREITLDDLGEMKYLERVIKETLRLYPPVPIIGRVLEEDTVIGGYDIPAGIDVGIFIYHLHRDPKYFPEPEKFDPDRFLPDMIKERHPFAYIPFSAGSRNCIGQKFAMNEEKTILASILRNYKVISLEKPEDMVIMFELVLRSNNGFKIKLERRN